MQDIALRQQPTSPPQLDVDESTIGAAVSRSTTTLLRIGFSIGLLSNAAIAIPALFDSVSPAASALSIVWCIPWLLAAKFPAQAGGIVTEHVWRVVGIGTLMAAVSVAFTGGFDSYLKTSVNWLPWIVAVLFSARHVLGSAMLICVALATSMAITSGTAVMFSESNRYTTVSDLLNPWLVGLVALSLAGVFRATFKDVGATLAQFRNGDWSASNLAIAAATTRIELAGPAKSRIHRKQPTLTHTEREILDLLASGLSPKEIAFSTRRSPETVYEHIASAKRKYDTKSIAGLVAIAWRPK